MIKHHIATKSRYRLLALRVVRLAMLLAVTSAFTRLADAEAPESVAVGHRLAAEQCAQCHAIARNQGAGWTDAPSFASIAERHTTTAAWLEGIIERPHAHMMHLVRNQSDAADLAAYILSLKKR